MIDSKRSAFLKSLEYIIDGDGNRRYIYPMKIEDYYIVKDLFSRINTQIIVFNMPEEQWDGEIEATVLNTVKYDAMMDILSLALNSKVSEIEKWIDIRQIKEILAKYQCISKLVEQVDKTDQEIGIIDWKVIITGIVANTSLTDDAVRNMTIAQLEDFYEGMAKNNDSNEKPPEALREKEAVEELRRLGFLE